MYLRSFRKCTVVLFGVVTSSCIILTGCTPSVGAPTEAPVATTEPTPTSMVEAEVTVEREDVPETLPVAESERLVIQGHDATGFMPTDLHGATYAWHDFEGRAYITDFKHSQTRQLPVEGQLYGGPVLSARYAAWLEKVDEIEVEHEGQRNRYALTHIAVYDRETGERHRITTEAVPRQSLVLDGDHLVWMDKRDEMEKPYHHYDIYAFNLQDETEYPVAVAPGTQQAPDVHGEQIVWADNRNSAERDSTASGCNNCPENNFDIYLYDIVEGTSRPLVEDDAHQNHPTVYGPHVAWVQYNDYNGDVYLLNLETGNIQQITETPVGKQMVDLFGENQIGWIGSQACDVISLDGAEQEVEKAFGVHVMNLDTGETRRLSDYVEPRAAFDSGFVLISEGCMAEEESYIVELDAD